MTASAYPSPGGPRVRPTPHAASTSRGSYHATARVCASGALDRLYTGLSLLVSTAAEGEPALGLATFAALDPLLDDALHERALDPAATPALTPEGRATFARSLVALRDTAAELPACRIWACAAAVETTGAQPGDRLEGVLSTPRFLREAGDARLVVV